MWLQRKFTIVHTWNGIAYARMAYKNHNMEYFELRSAEYGAAPEAKLANIWCTAGR